ncbi:hypothetical protein TTHERM_00706450 (macronuclear) [Tetrahymena thermophila SB210]|uniref:Uncharacterized protein n=1 Tax=Tetrahymena thermophila (strain SB210) TaxID=312017 RepID=I7M0Q3_TETTS|nr:hypothetical protein TTHERM_00706450 [Tetrahymena thermophila SB210]EAR90730.2 hypothetical protein TTHERM_00706450 [Tetrahymena thermophila SB210]|eukprot:XP_001010975.2 hypothetical protein TTHERM_00706450 [Tetrahymena thermophila SB210]
MNKFNIFVYYYISLFYSACFGEDRFVSYINGNQDMGVVKFNCPDSQSVQFKNQFYGSPLETIYTYNFNFETNIPHFQKEVNIDFIFFRKNGNNQITVSLDGVNENKFEIYYPFLIQELCNSKYGGLKEAYKQFEQLLKYRQKYQQSGNQIQVSVNEKKQMFNFKALVISSIQININTCHQTCLSCNDSSANSCTSCSQDANFQNGKCSCKDSGYFFQDGQCVKICSNAQGYHQKISSEQVCTYIQNCQSWDIKNQKCIKCQGLMLPQFDKCVNNCSSGFQPVLNPETKSQECLLTDRYKNGTPKELISNIISFSFKRFFRY